VKLWQKEIEISKEIEKFTLGLEPEFDLLLAPYDVVGTTAHIIMLEKIGLLNSYELSVLCKTLREITGEILLGKFILEKGVEDIHSQVEFFLTKRIGKIGKKIHSGRSRNDQILLDLRLFTRAEIQKIVFLIRDLFETLINLSEIYKEVLIPGYTHYQMAMPSSFGLWLSAYAESLIDDLVFIRSAYHIVNRNPLGSAAGYGSSFPLIRYMTSYLLGFETLNYNVVYAQMGRGKTERITSSAISSIASTLSKLSQDVCLYLSHNFSFISFSDSLTTGSSIMPHKKNPDVFELIRARCNRLIAFPNEISLMIANSPSGYHRDLQVIKERFLPIFSDLKNCLRMANYVINKIILKKDLLFEEKYQQIFSVEVVNNLTKHGMPFRDAYKKVYNDFKNGVFKFSVEINHTHEGSIGNLCNKEIFHSMKKILDSFNFEKINQAIYQLLYFGRI